MKHFLRFLISKTFFKNFGLAVSGATLLILFSILFLRFYTFHNRALELPDFYGLNIKEVEKTVKKKRIRYEIVDSVYKTDAKKGTVVHQNPRPGFKVKKHRRVFLTMNAIKPEKTTMPNVIRVTLRQAKAMLEAQGLYVGKMTYVPDMAINSVLRQMINNQDIKPGQEVIKGSQIDLVLGNGNSYNSTATPDVTRLTLRAAKNKLLNNYINIGSVIYDKDIKSYKDSIKAVIWKQKPTKGSYMRYGAAIDIWMTLDTTKIETK